jgi:hypothetical protein
VAADQVVEQLRRCFVQHTEVRGTVHVSATSTLSVSFVDGAVAQLHLDPPLAPAVEQCGRRAALSVDVVKSPDRLTVTREIWLSR